ncbi:hypothetical protein BASA60_002069 [Batrachochytrium salamandrivorans]|nr:hypothetical protein BASA60_002069 [Batrachochytrium salamandrivorans]
MSSRPPNPLIPYEFMLQKYLSRPGHENPYVPMALDYYILKDAFILVMEYVDENWVDLSKYVDEKGPLDIETVRGHSQGSHKWNDISETVRYCAYGHACWKRNIIPASDIQLVHSNDEQAIRETIPDESDPYKRGLKEKATRLMAILGSFDPEQISSIEAILNDPFFN